MRSPGAVAVDTSGNLYVSDLLNSRVTQFKPPFTNGMNASVVFGAPDFTSSACATGATGLCNPASVVTDSSGNLWVADVGIHRILQYKPPFSNGMAATLAIGQANMSDSSCNRGTVVGDNTLCFAFGVAVDASGNLWVADSGNSRVLKYAAPLSMGQSATVVLGQTSFNANSCNQFGGGTQSGNLVIGGAGAGTLCGPTALVFDGSGNLWVADTQNSRVLKYAPPFITGMSATVVLGQTDFNGAYCNQQNPVGPSAPIGGAGAGTLCRPQGLVVDASGNVIVGDTQNHRTMMFASPFTSGMSATKVLGQTDFTHNSSNQGNVNPSAPTQYYPFGSLQAWD